jgi:hypothetical protein
VASHVSVAYFELEPEDDGTLRVHPLDNRHGYLPTLTLRASWNGMRVETESTSNFLGIPVALRSIDLPPNTMVEVDWTDDAAGQLAVDRNTFQPSPQATAALEAVVAKARARLADLVESHPSPLSLINTRLLGLYPVDLDTPSWLRGSAGAGPEQQSIAPLRFPVKDADAIRFHDESDLQWRGESLDAIPALEIVSLLRPGEELDWHGSSLRPTKVGVIDEFGSRRPIPIWEDLSPAAEDAWRPADWGAEFPPDAERLLGIGSGSERVWNLAHPVVPLPDRPAWEWATSTFAESVDPIPHAEELLESPARVAAWILLAVHLDQDEIWNGLADRAPDLLTDAWRVLGVLGEDEPLLDWVAPGRNGTLRRITTQAWRFEQGEAAIDQLIELFDDPPDQWWLSYSDGARELKTLEGLGG